MTTPKSTIVQSPATKRALEGRLPAKALDARQPASVNFECAYCGFAVSEGAIIAVGLLLKGAL